MSRLGFGVCHEGGIFFLCDQLHAHNNGSGEALPENKKVAIKLELRERLKRWEEGKGRWQKYDNCVKALVEAVLDEADWTD